jgi:K(+)-stimulated pyrophosphate-energized sodium pump
VQLSVGSGANTPLRVGIAVAAVLIVVAAVTVSKRRPIAIGASEENDKHPEPVAGP